MLAAPVRPVAARPGRDPIEVEAAVFPFPPEMVVSDGQAPTGFAVEVLDEVAARAGLTVRYRRFGSGGEALAALRSGRVDLIPSLGNLERRRESLEFSEPLSAVPTVLVVRRDEVGIGRLEDLGEGRSRGGGCFVGRVGKTFSLT